MTRNIRRQTNLAGTGVTLKNHVSPRSTQIQGELQTKFGINFKGMIKAMMGDEKEAKKIGELGRQGRMMKDFAPLVKQRVLDAIEGTKVYNESVAEINIASGNAGTAIDRAADSAELANVKWVDDRTLRLVDFENSTEQQQVASARSLNYLMMKNEINRQLASTDDSYKMLQLELQPVIKDVALQEQHKIEMAKYKLEVGAKAIDQHKPIKQYGGHGLVHRIRETLFGQ